MKIGVKETGQKKRQQFTRYPNPNPYPKERIERERERERKKKEVLPVQDNTLSNYFENVTKTDNSRKFLLPVVVVVVKQIRSPPKTLQHQLRAPTHSRTHAPSLLLLLQKITLHDDTLTEIHEGVKKKFWYQEIPYKQTPALLTPPSKKKQ